MVSRSSRWESSAPIRYPDPDIVVLDKRFRHLVVPMAAIERIATGFRFTEGPVYYGDGRYLLFSDIPNDTLVRWDELTGTSAILRHNAGHPDGSTRDRQGRLVTCELGSRTLTRTEHDGTVTVLADTFEGTRLTGPNDVIVKSDGTIWFSDNGAGIRGNYMGDKAPKEMPYRVYKLDPRTGALTIAVGDMERPNGLCLLARRIEALRRRHAGRPAHHARLRHGRRQAGERPACSSTPRPASPTASASTPRATCGRGFSGGEGQDGVAVFAPDGTLIGRILLPERCANLCFGGKKRNRLFMTASQSVYALYVEAQGVAGG